MHLCKNGKVVLMIFSFQKDLVQSITWALEEKSNAGSTIQFNSANQDNDRLQSISILRFSGAL